MTKNTMRCFIIGEDNLHIECAKILKEKGHIVLGMISSHEPAEAWAINNDVPYYPSLALAEEPLLKTSFDYLFSIVNPHILSKQILKSPQEFAINFHDSLLPRYAGVHATSWAIVNQEARHGISWHVADEVVDTGDILEQAMVEILEDETALSLNLKCYEAALGVFPGLVDALAQQSYQRRPQDLSLRTYFSYAKKPAGNGWINWYSSAQEIERFGRAFHMGAYPNRFSSLKFTLGENVFIVDKMSILPEKSEVLPGTILSFSESYWRIATTTQDVAISRVYSIDGVEVLLKNLKKIYTVKIGDCLHSPAPSCGQALAHTSQIYFKKESYWVKKWSEFNATNLDFLSVTNANFYKNNYLRVASLSLSKKLPAIELASSIREIPLSTLLLTGWLIYLYKISDQNQLHFFMANNPSVEASIAAFISHEFPCVFPCKDDMSFQQAANLAIQLLAETKQPGNYLRDILYRYPQLNQAKRAPIAVILADGKNLKSYFQQATATLILEINTKTNRLNWYLTHNSQALVPDLSFILRQIPGHIDRLLTTAMYNPKILIKDIDFLTVDEYQQIIRDWNPSEKKYECDKTIHQLFEEQVKRTPGHIAACFEKQSLTYEALNQKANQLADYLRKKGVTTETLVSICLRPCIEMIISIVGVLKAGGAYVPIDPEFPSTRISYILEDTQCQFIISNKQLHSIFASYPHKFIDVEDTSIFLQGILANIPSATLSHNLAYVIYTSGSTGNPKGVLIEHANVVHLFHGTKDKFRFSSNDVWSLAHSFNFDFSVWEIFGALLHGGKIVVVPKEITRSADEFYTLIVSEKITILNQTPTAFYQIIKADMSMKKNMSLRLVIFGGEAISFKSLLPWIKRHGDKKPALINMYGITETTVHVTYYHIKDLQSTHSTHSIIGKPFNGRTVYVLDRNNNLLPAGIIGELYVGGTGIARGYLHLSEMNNERFSINKLPGCEGERIYKTGDMVRWLADGNLEYIGRRDSQIKIRGFRIELTEIENALLATGSLLQAVVLPVTSKASHQKLAAYIVLDENQAMITDDELKLQLKKRLPSYMIPSHFYKINKLPLTSNGKLDVQKLVQVNTPSLLLGSHSISIPKDKKQAILMEIFSDVFKCNIEINDDFFALGGDSILAMQVCAKSKKYGIQLSVKNIFDSPVLAELANHIEIKLGHENKKSKLSGKLPLTPIQHWFFHKNLYRKKFFSQACLLEVPYDLEINTLNAVIFEVLKIHDVFRLGFKKAKQGWLQFYHPYSYEAIQLVEMEEASISEMESIIQELTYQVQNNFNLKKGPLFGGYLIKLDLAAKKNTPSLLLMVVHHLLIDGVSWRILLEEIEKQFRLNSYKEPLLITADPFQSWAKAVKNYALSPELMMTQSYWEKICDKSLSIPLDYPLGENIEGSSVIVESACTKETTLLLNQISQMYDVRLNEVLIALLVRVLSVWLESDDINIDLESHGRSEVFGVDASHTVGWFTSLFPVCLHCDQSDTWSMHINNIKEQLRAIPHYGIDYGMLRFLLEKNSKKLDYKPQISFNFWGGFDHIFPSKSTFKFKWLKLVSHPKNLRTHVLNVESFMHNGQISFQWIYSKNIHNSKTIQQIAKNYILALNKLVKSCVKKNVANANSLLNLSEDGFLLSEKKFARAEQFSHSYLLTPLQKGLLFQTLSDPSSGSYVTQFWWKSKKLTDTSTLKRAFQFIVNRHDVLRTRFSWEKLREPIQIVEDKAELLWQEYDWRSITKEEQDKRMTEFLQADRQANFSLDTAPLLRGGLVFISDNECWVIFTSHHILLDGWSMSLLLKELGLMCKALEQGSAIHLPRPVSYENYIHWLQKQDLKSAETFWGDYLKTIENPISLTKTFLIKEEKSKVKSFDYKFLTLPHQLSNKIRLFLKEHKFTLSTFFHGLWAILLDRYCQNNDVIFGTTISVRPAEIENSAQMMGLMINTLPFCMNCKLEHTVLSFLSLVQRNLLRIMEYNYTPLNNIQSIANKMGISHQLFETLLVVENYPISEITGLHLNFYDINIIDPTHYPLTLAIIPDRKIAIKFSYDVYRVNKDMLFKLIKHTQVLINEFINKPNQLIQSLSILTPQEYENIIYKWSFSKLLPLKNDTVQGLFESQVEKNPHNIAATFEGKNITYSELNNKANQLAHYLRNNGLTIDKLVGILLSPSIELLIGILAVLKAGGAYLPVDDRYPIERIQKIFKDANIEFLITQSNANQKINIKNIILIDKFDDSEDRINLKNINNSNDLAYVIYTSGSTGKPKGVMIEHRSLINLVDWHKDAFNITQNDKATVYASPAFDASVWEIFPYLLSGAQLYIIPEYLKLDMKCLNDFYKKNKISLSFLPSIVCKKLLEFKNISLRILFTGGEELQKLPDNECLVINNYGPTENTVVTTSAVIARNDSQITIGRPITNVFIYVLDRYLNPTPEGVIGELYIGGANLSRGYLSDFDTVSFIDNPFKTELSPRLYKTGDLVRWLPGGTLAFVSRIDAQIKLRGFRIELAEIQIRLEEYNDIERAVVVLTKTSSDQKILVAYLVKRKNTFIDIKQLKIYLSEFLPNFMIPSAYVFIDKIPLTFNGKVDKNSLPDFDNAECIYREYAPPVSSMEKTVIDIWSKVLGIHQIGVNDHFFDLGGNSFILMEILSLVHTTFGIDLKISEILKNPTVSNFIKLIELCLKEKNDIDIVTRNLKNYLFNCLVPLKASGKKTPLFLIHPVGGTVFWYIPLIKYFDPDRPLYGIQDPEIEINTQQFNSIQETANFYIQAIRSIQPSGPYLIGGASGGANISVEIAHQLDCMGQKTLFIGLMDGWASFPDCLHSQAFFQANMRRQYNEMHDKFMARNIKNAETLLALQWKRSKMFATYRAPVLHSKLTLFKAIDMIPTFESIQAPFNHWEHYSTEPVETHLIPGDHETMFQEPNVQTLWERLSLCLEKTAT